LEVDAVPNAYFTTLMQGAGRFGFQEPSKNLREYLLQNIVDEEVLGSRVHYP
jgi:hypothetical protein